MKALFGTDDSWASLFLRVTLGLVMFPHGAQKLLGWFGGFGFDGTMGFFTQKMGLPWIIAFLVIMGEFFGSLALIGLLLEWLGLARIDPLLSIGIAIYIAYAGLQLGRENASLLLGESASLLRKDELLLRAREVEQRSGLHECRR